MARRRARAVARRLHAAYGSPDHNNKRDALAEAVFIVLSQMTTHHSFNRVFDRLERRIQGRWERLATMRQVTLRTLIGDAGLGHTKAAWLRDMVRQVIEDFGVASLEDLREAPDGEVIDYLTGLPGISIKSAKCIAMYSLGRQVLPVDTHVARLSRRLGLVPAETGASRLHRLIEQVVPTEHRYSFHVNALMHGRAVCIARQPRCAGCTLRRLCPSNSL